MSENLGWLPEQIAYQNQQAQRRISVVPNGGGPHDSNMSLTEYRLDQADKRHDAMVTQLGAIQTTLNDMRVEMVRQAGDIRTDLATTSTKGTIWTAVGVLAGIIVAVGSFFWASSGNQLSAFQAGLSAVQTGLAVHQAAPTSAPSPTATTAPSTSPP